jgi:hypothetical protein
VGESSGVGLFAGFSVDTAVGESTGSGEVVVPESPSSTANAAIVAAVARTAPPTP